MRCRYCGEVLRNSMGGYVDKTGGDCCSGNDELENENEPHVPIGPPAENRVSRMVDQGTIHSMFKPRET